jgi:hypothetical protein
MLSKEAISVAPPTHPQYDVPSEPRVIRPTLDQDRVRYINWKVASDECEARDGVVHGNRMVGHAEFNHGCAEQAR